MEVFDGATDEARRASRGHGLQGVATTMFEIRRFVAGHQSDKAGPQPGWGIQAFRPVTSDFGAPRLACRRVHLARVRLADDSRQEMRCLHRVSSRKLIDLQLQILRKQLAYKHRSLEQPLRGHSFPQVR